MKRKLIYEIKECDMCKTEFEWSSAYKAVICKQCRMKEHNKKHKLSEEELKKPYPFDENEKKKRWNRIRKEHDKCFTREQYKEHYDKCLEDIMHNGVWEWIIDRRTDDKKERQKSISGKKGRPKDNELILELPDTRNMNE